MFNLSSDSTTSLPLAPTRAERVRLMRSARKIQSVLGEIPILGDPSSPTPMCESTPTRPVLSVHPPLAGTPTPTSPHPHSPTSPSTPTPGAQEDRDAARRRIKMSKLARTLGENVPPELVFSNSSSAPRRPQRASSLSVFDLNVPVADAHRSRGLVKNAGVY